MSGGYAPMHMCLALCQVTQVPLKPASPSATAAGGARCCHLQRVLRQLRPGLGADGPAEVGGRAGSVAVAWRECAVVGGDALLCCCSLRV